MKKFGYVASASAFASSHANAYRAPNWRPSTSPFVGENANAQIIEGEERSTHRATPVASLANKYEPILSKMNREKDKTPETKLYEWIFGTAEAKQHSSKRLRAVDGQMIVTNQKEDLFTAAFYMGGFQQMGAIIDTATDFVAIEGADCSTCNGETYDISTNVDRGQASIES